MNEKSLSLDAEKLVLVHHARNEWVGNMVVEFLRQNGIDAELRNPPAVPPLDSAEKLTGSGTVNGVYVLEHESDHAREVIAELQRSVADPRQVEAEAAHGVKLDAERIGELRQELREERKTFDLLGWLVVTFFVAAAVLWIIWPAWLKAAVSYGAMRWVMVLMFVLAAVFAGSWANRAGN